MSVYFTVLSRLEKAIRTTSSYWKKIVTLKHPIMRGQEESVRKTLIDPDCVVQTERDKDVYIYYRRYYKRFICVVVRHENGTGFIITAYPADKIKEERIYMKNLNKLKLYHDTKGNTLTVWFDDASKEYVCEEIGDDTIVMKDKKGIVIGLEKLNYHTNLRKGSSRLPVEVVTM